MATLTKEKRSGKITGYNIQWLAEKRRYTIYLSSRKYSEKTAERLKGIVEVLLYYRRNEITVPDKKTEQWLKDAPSEVKEKLVKADLITVTRPKTCKEVWDAYLRSKTDIKMSTLELYFQCQTLFFRTFAETEFIDKLTSERLLEWKTSLLEEYAEASVAGYIKNLSAMLNWVVKKQKWLTENPLEDISRGSFVNRKNDRTISMAEYFQLLDACPSQEWRTIIALARIGGLRCPSELQQLRWSDIDWAKDRFSVRSPKTEHHAGKDKREVPLFAELFEELDRHFLLDETVGNEFVIQGLQGTSWKLRNMFNRISNNAGLGTIIRPFDNMRTSRSNEVRSRWGDAIESTWIGHSPEIMKKHYLCPSDEEFAQAAGRCPRNEGWDKRGT